MTPRRARGRGANRAGAGARREWIGGRVSPPFFIGEGDEPERAELAVWLEAPSGLVVGQDVFVQASAAGAVGRALSRALERPLAGPPRRPDAIRVADSALAAEVRAAIGDSIPVAVAATPELDAVLAQMLDWMSEQESEESYLEGGRIPPEAVRKLFAAAEILYRAAPWKVATGDAVLRMDIPALGVEGACVSILGNLGESFGLLVFPSLAGFEKFLRAAETASRARRPVDVGTRWLALEFERGAELPASLRHEIATHRWPVAGAGAYPRVTHYDRDGVARPLAERDLQIAAACARSLAPFFLVHRRLFSLEEPEPVCESYFDDDELEVRFTLPYEAFPLFELAGAPPQSAAPATAASGRVSRNAPCPCGSGRKYKKCCLARDEAVSGAGRGVHASHELDIRLVRALSEFADRRHGAGWLGSREGFADDGNCAQLAIPWALYHRRIDGATVLERYLDERHRRLSAVERGWLEAQRAAWLSVWEVTSVEPGVTVTLRDLLSGEAREVRETTASRSLVRRDAVLARVVDSEGVSLFCGLHPRALPPVEAADVVQRVRATLRRKGTVPTDRLRDEAVGRALIRRWEAAVTELDARSRALPELRNTDGDPFLLTTDHFDLAPGARAAVEARLAALPDVTPPTPGEDEPVYVFLRAGNRMHRSWQNTIVGQVRLSDRGLRAETTSRERADALRERLETACGDGLRHRAREHADPLSERAARALPSTVPERAVPEAEQLLLEFKQQHYAHWLDEPIPALHGKTPRQAAQTSQGRAAVDLLLKDMENREDRLPSASARFEFSALRRELRFDEGGEG